MNVVASAPAAGGGLKVTQSNKRMHANRDTTDVINPQLGGGRVMRGVMRLRYVKEVRTMWLEVAYEIPRFN